MLRDAMLDFTGVQPSQRNNFCSVDAKRPCRICHVWVPPSWLSRNEQINAWFVISIQSWSDLEENQVELVSQKKGISVLGSVPTSCREWGGPSCGRDWALLQCLGGTGREMVNRWAGSPGTDRDWCPTLTDMEQHVYTDGKRCRAPV